MIEPLPIHQELVTSCDITIELIKDNAKNIHFWRLNIGDTSKDCYTPDKLILELEKTIKS